MDGYAGFASLVKARPDASIKLAFCWAHARRPFYEFHQSTQSMLAAEVLARIPRCMRSRPTSAASQPRCDSQSVSSEAGR